ncbi:hypothetical protein [Macrococcus epidermidis]|uniref:hypothetical protein n=1 Tax=Macrococcus epidermidis TaxID=1902580 RepID=UPI0020B8F9A4|nr:hypothetical protein [Macrococcus epidermidis]UTH16964.1 hypothetical protein KFV12_04110 [Macrococcus epidermidis]
MKTQYLFDTHEQLINDNSMVIADLQESIRTKKGDLDTFNKQYEEFIKNGDDDKADKLFSEIVKAETDIKMTQKKLETKRPILKNKEIDNAIEVCTHLKDLPNLYKEEAEILKDEYIEAKKKLDEAENKIKELNREFDNEYQDYVDLFDEYHGDYPHVNKDFVERAKAKGISKNAGEFPLRKSTSVRIINLYELNKEIGGNN